MCGGTLQGPAWANSLFEDNAEFGMGMRRAYKQRRDNMMNMVDDVLQDKVIRKRASTRRPGSEAGALAGVHP